MSARSYSVGLALAAGILGHALLHGGDEGVASSLPPSPEGVEVLARGPVHEAFASLTVDPTPTKALSKRPPKPLDEQPPEEKPEGNVTWIGGYWAWDDDRSDYLWVSGTWRVPPPGKEWIAGYWREDNDNWQWVPGFWTAVARADAPQQVTYLPTPPVAPPQASPGQPPIAESFWVPGHWVWNGSQYLWQAGYWARVQPGYVWVAAHYSWTPGGYVYVAGYWDLAVKRRGILYAPVVFRPGVVTVSYSYTPAYAVPDTMVVDTLFVRPAYGHYYFGDYYGPAYHDIGFESAYVYGSAHYDSIIVYERYEHRSDPAWFSVQVNLFNNRYAGRAPVPPRTIVQNTTVVNNVTNVTNVTNNTTNITKNVANNTNVTNNNTTNNVNNTNNVTKTAYNGPTVAPAKQVAAAQGIKTTPLTPAARQQVKAQATATQQVAVQRTQNESTPARGASTQARTAPLSTPKSPSSSTAGNSASSTGRPANPGASASTQSAGTKPATSTGASSTQAAGSKPAATTQPTTTSAAGTSASKTGSAPANSASTTNTRRPPPPPAHRPQPKSDGKEGSEKK